MAFLPGDHVLDADITVVNVSWLIMSAESSPGNERATIVCSGPVGLNFTNMVNFKIQSLAFTSCSRTYTFPVQVLNSIFTPIIGVQFALPSLPNTGYTLLLQYTQYAELVDCFFHDNNGIALVVLNSSIIAENNNFTHNYCEPSKCNILGGGISAISSNLTFIGNTTFIANYAICAGAGIFTFNSTLHSTGNLHFKNNSNVGSTTIYGLIGISNVGTIFAHTSSLHFNGTNNFINNSAQSPIISNCGGAICALVNTSLSFTGTNNFINNSAEGNNNSFGGAIFARINCMLSITGTSNFSSNYARQGGAIFSIDNNNLTFDGNITFTNNGCSRMGTIGGGMHLYTSYLHIMPDTTVYLENNCATFGGAIFVADQINPLIFCPQIVDPINRNTIDCFYQLPDHDLSNNIRLIFRNNSAELEGDALYGGAIDNCRQNSYHSGDVFDTIFDIEYDNTNSEIYPNPLRMCPCGDSRPNCDSYITRTVYPGETFHLSVVASGRQNRKVSATVGSRIQDADSELQGSQYTQETNSNCTPLNFTVFSLLNSVWLELYEEGYCGTFGDILNIRLTINQTCPPGFNISEMSKSCVCEKRLQRFTKSCNITTRNVTRDAGEQFWVGYVHEHESHGNASDGLILHQLCPFDYCTSETVDFPLNNTDIQCAHNRSGLLCGACRTNYSLVLGTSYCKQCTNSYLALLILFAVMGVALVFFLFVCKVTVATGALSGLVFYANIVGVNRTIFLPVESTDPISVFIAWLNLDFGIEICFYDGMDAYSQTWLQFMFPAYLWMIVGLVILVSHFSHRFAKLLGNNPVSVLATLILLSYTKILRTLIAAINFTHLEYPTDNRTVWLYDANINYLSGKHIPLFIVAVLVFLFLFIPYTLLLIFDQWLQAISHIRLFSWVNKLKPFMDSYHAPYKAKHRYWPGLLLVLRFVLLLVLAIEFSPQRDRTSINLLSILVVAGTLQLWAWISGGVYRNWCLDALEGSFSLNLIILASATSYINSSERDQLAVGHTSGSIALIMFIGILTYHIFQQLKDTKLWEKVPKLNLKFKSLNIKQAVNDIISRPEHPCEATQNKAVTHTEIDLHELRSPLNLVSTK